MAVPGRRLATVNGVIHPAPGTWQGPQSLYTEQTGTASRGRSRSRRQPSVTRGPAVATSHITHIHTRTYTYVTYAGAIVYRTSLSYRTAVGVTARDRGQSLHRPPPYHHTAPSVTSLVPRSTMCTMCGPLYTGICTCIRAFASCVLRVNSYWGNRC